MTERTSLRDYQRELAERLRSAGARRGASKLGLQVGDEAWLVELSEAGEVIPVPPIMPIPLTRPWFRGMANIRGNLYSVVDFPDFLGRGRAEIGEQSRLLLIGEQFRLGAALLVDRSLGLRNPEQLKRRAANGTPWVRAEYEEPDGRQWKELDLPQLVHHERFLSVGA